MKTQYIIKKRMAKAAETLLSFKATQWQAQRVARALSYVYVQTGAVALELHASTAAGERCVARWGYKGVQA